MIIQTSDLSAVRPWNSPLDLVLACKGILAVQIICGWFLGDKAHPSLHLSCANQISSEQLIHYVTRVKFMEN